MANYGPASSEAAASLEATHTGKEATLCHRGGSSQ